MSDDRLQDEEEFPLGPPQKDWPRARGKECVLVAEDSEALRQIERHHGVDLVITDAIMPRGGGFQIIDEMRGSWPGTPIVITSGFTEEIEAGLRERTRAQLEPAVEPPAEGTDEPAREAPEVDSGGPPLPIIEFLPKPFRPEQLAHLVREVIDRSRSDAPRKRG